MRVAARRPGFRAVKVTARRGCSRRAPRRVTADRIIIGGEAIPEGSQATRLPQSTTPAGSRRHARRATFSFGDLVEAAANRVGGDLLAAGRARRRTE